MDTALVEAPYDRLIALAGQSKTDADLIAAVGQDAWKTALMAASTVDEGQEGTYLDLLRKVASYAWVGTRLKKQVDKMLRGDEPDLTTIQEAMVKLDAAELEFIRMDEVSAETDIWRPTYYKPWDDYFSGMPRYGLIIVAAPPGTGKTSLVVSLIDKMTWHKKEVGFFSLEMTKEVVKMRWQQLHSGLSPTQAHRLLVSDVDYSLDEVCSSIARLVAQHPDLYAVMIDYADLMVILESTETTSQIYIKLAKLARKVGKPIFLISQLNGEGLKGIPKVNNIRYSRLAEAAASMIALLYNPDQLYTDASESKEDQRLPYVEGMGYIILGKSRFGFKMGGPGAVRVPWDGLTGWGDTADGWERL